MFRSLLIVFGFIFGSWVLVSAQNGLPSAGGGRGMALSRANLLFRDVDAIWGNQAGLAFVEDWAAAVYGEQAFGLADLRRLGFGAALRLGQGAVGLSIEQFGFSAYKDQKIGLSYARQLFKNTALAVQFDYLATRIPDYGQAHRLSAELGLITRLNKEWELGVHLYNPFPVVLPNEDRLPSLLRLGLGYRPNEHLLLCAQADKDLRHPLSLRFGVEYELMEYLVLRAGYATQPAQSSFGFGLRLEGFRLDLGMAYQPILGISPALTLAYAPAKPLKTQAKKTTEEN